MFAMGPAFFQGSGAATLALGGTFSGAQVGATYSSSLAISGGVAPYSLTGGTGLSTGSLPAGLALSISGSTLVLSGTPTAAGTDTFTASVTSTDAQTATSAQSVTVAANVTVRGAFAQWNLDEVAGTTAADSTGNGHAATYANSFTLGQPSLTPSAVGKSVALSHAGSGYIGIPTGFISALTRPFSLLAFVKFNAIGRGQQIFASATGGINFYVGTDGKLAAGTSGVANLAVDTRVLSAGTSYLVALTVGSTGDAHIYVNTTASATFAGAFGSSAAGADLARIGDWYNSGTSFQYSLDGYIQRVILSNVELSSTEIGTYYSSL